MVLFHPRFIERVSHWRFFRVHEDAGGTSIQLVIGIVGIQNDLTRLKVCQVTFLKRKLCNAVYVRFTITSLYDTVRTI